MELNTDKRVVGRPFPKGVSGNPGGVPKDEISVRTLARSKGPRCIELLMGIAEDTDEKTEHRIAACEVLLDRGFGKPVQEASLDVNIKPQVVRIPQHLNVPDLEALYQSGGQLIEHQATKGFENADENAV